MLLIGLIIACKPTPVEPPRPITVVINEALSNGGDAWTDPDGPGECPEADDWIELYNTTDGPIRLDGMFLSDDPESPERFALPDVQIESHGYVLVVADGDPGQGPLHATFALDADGETITLTDADGELDRVVLPALSTDESWGRWGDGGPALRPQLAPTPGAANDAPPDDACFFLDATPTFDEHSVPCILTEEGFFALAQERAGLAVVKTDILRFQEPDRRHAVFVDSRFFALHDEYYYFQMLNGHRFEGEHQYNPYPGEFATIPDIYAWAESVDIETLFDPDFLRWTADGRLYSPRYYDLTLGSIRYVGVATLVYVPADGDQPERWAFELEASDHITEPDLNVYFEVLAQQTFIGDDLMWLVRSTDQEAVAQYIEDQGGPYADRILRYTDLAQDGEVEVYRPGTVAGRVRIVRPGEPGLEDAQPTDILVLGEIPDALPPCAALITAVPQTPLAHIALLAESRGIPNVYAAGLTEDPSWDSWARVRSPVAIRATSPDSLEVVQLSAAEWATWQSLQLPPTPIPTVVNWDAQPYTVDLGSIPIEQMDDWRPILGGKSAGYIALLATGVPTPENPLAISGRAYHEQVASIPEIEEVLDSGPFAHPGDARARYLVLEGHVAYDARYTGRIDEQFRDEFIAEHQGDALGPLASGNGLRGLIATTPLLPAIHDQIDPAIAAQFADFAPSQGLRFRSSSNVEDMEGFVGAGLYESETGFIDPDAAGEPGDTLDRAIQKVFASYWGSEAFEERHTAYIDHLAGSMGLTVHARFDDDLENANGVITTIRMPSSSPIAWEMQVNSQPGDISVTNPPIGACPEVLPEVVRVRLFRGDDTPQIERLQRSTELPDGDVLADAELLQLFGQSTAVNENWLAVSDADLPPEELREVLSLDMEFRRMDDGWPAFADGHTLGERLLLKQSRSLDPSTDVLPDEIQAEPFPRDLLARARVVSSVSCTGGGFELSWVEATTDPLQTPDMGYSDLGFVAQISLLATSDQPDIGWDGGDGVDATHVQMSLDRSGTGDHPLSATLADLTVVLDADGLSVENEVGSVSAAVTCTETVLWASPDVYLDTLLGP